MNRSSPRGSAFDKHHRLAVRLMTPIAPPYEILIAREVAFESVTDSHVRRAVETTLLRHQVSAARVSVALVGDRRIAELNERYLKHPGPTDVLSFDLRDAPTDGRQSMPVEAVDGEVVISVETALREAERRGHSVLDEVSLYAIHGVLHLLGYDDGVAEDALRMRHMEDVLLELIGVEEPFRSGQ